MRTTSSPRTSHFRSALLWITLCVGATACGQDNAEAPDASDGRNRCLSPGIGGTCMCGPGRNGTNTCGEDGYWTSCVCVSLPDGAICREGDALRCTNLCPGENAPRMTRCVGGSYDCRCTSAGDSDGGAIQDAGC